MHDHLEFIAGSQQLLGGRAVGLGREGDPAKVAAQRVDTTGFQVQRQRVALGISHLGLENGAEGIEVVVQGFTARDHHKGSPVVGGVLGGSGDRLQRQARVRVLGPGVFGVAPAAAHLAAGQAKEKGAAARMQPFPLEGMEGFHHRQGQGRRWRFRGRGGVRRWWCCQGGWRWRGPGGC